MFHNTPNGLQLETPNGWTISISLAGADAKEYCEIAVWPIGHGTQDDWVRWGANSIEPPDFPIYSRVLGYLTYINLLQIINGLSAMPVEEVEPNKWLSKGMAMEAKWR